MQQICLVPPIARWRSWLNVIWLQRFWRWSRHKSVIKGCHIGELLLAIGDVIMEVCDQLLRAPNVELTIKHWNSRGGWRCVWESRTCWIKSYHAVTCVCWNDHGCFGHARVSHNISAESCWYCLTRLLAMFRGVWRCVRRNVFQGIVRPSTFDYYRFMLPPSWRTWIACKVIAWRESSCLVVHLCHGTKAGGTIHESDWKVG